MSPLSDLKDEIEYQIDRIRLYNDAPDVKTLVELLVGWKLKVSEAQTEILNEYAHLDDVQTRSDELTELRESVSALYNEVQLLKENNPHAT